MDKIDENTKLRFLMANKWDVDVAILLFLNLKRLENGSEITELKI